MKKIQPKYEFKTSAHETVAIQCHGENIKNILTSQTPSFLVATDIRAEKKIKEAVD